MGAQQEISQRDLRLRSKEIMDAVQGGESFTVTRDGHPIGELTPLRHRRRFVSRAEFAECSRNAPAIGLSAFRADQDAAFEQTVDEPYARSSPARTARHQHPHSEAPHRRLPAAR